MTLGLRRRIGVYDINWCWNEIDIADDGNSSNSDPGYIYDVQGCKSSSRNKDGASII